MNLRLYAAAALLGEAALQADRGAFFGSLSATLQHIWQADVIWLKRFADHPARFAALDPVRAMPHPYTMQMPSHATFAGLQADRAFLDDVIEAFCADLHDVHFDEAIAYTNRAGDTFRKPFGALLLHCFNHQTHHRGQATTLLHQAGIDMGSTDLVSLVEEIHG
jgi:uncharacterized damage-inducible protein DinB